MNRIRIILLITVISIFSFLSLRFLKNYNSQENIEKRCALKFQSDLKSAFGKSDKEWNIILDEADISYLKCIGMPQN